MWTKYTEPPKIVNAVDVNNIFQNEKHIYDKLIELGLDVESVIDYNATPSLPYQIFPELYQLIEQNLDQLNNTEFRSAYYIDSVIRGEFEPNRAEWQRWIDVLNDMYDMTIGTKGKWQYLLTKDGYVYDKYEQPILIRGEKVNA